MRLARALLGVLLVTPPAAMAETWPSQPIRLIVPQPAGGGVDIVARLIAPALGERLGGTVVVDNRPGAGGGIGSELAARAAPDGHTLLLGNLTSHGIYPAAGKLPVDALRDFAPIGLIAETQDVVVAHPGLGIRTLAELIDRARAMPGRLDYATAGPGSGPHMAGELLKHMAGIDLTPIPYKGTGPAIADTASGQVKLMLPTLPSAIAMIRAGRLVPLAVTGERRSPLLPDVPTVAESGLPGYVVVEWYALLGPAGTPPERVARLNAALGDALAAPALRDALVAAGPEPAPGSPTALADFMAREIARWRALIRSAGLAID